ncbi:MAG: PASTA domain-containing protein [Clostridia bacterium]|nr:PASTA domain-containing protein [Clostridia bacterium]
MGLEKSLDFTVQILSALQHAHEKGVVHRDIKPQNIMVQAGGKLKVTDFGIAQISDTKQSNSGVAMGTVYYISPEQASGKTTTFSSDIYSVGIMLYVMATGKLPFEGDTPLSIAMMQVNSTPTRPRKIDPTLPQGLEQIILRAMNKAPENRFRSAKSMLRACEIIKKDKTVVFEDPTAKPAPAPVARVAEKPQKKETPTRLTLFPIIFGVTTAFLLVVAVAGILLLSSLIDMTSEDNTVVIPIPDLVGQTLTDELKASLEAQNIILSVKEVNNDVYDAGQISYQNPEGGQTRKIANQNQTVEISIEVSKGKKSFTLEDYKSKEYRKVRISLMEKGANVTVEEVFDPEVIAGHIISTVPEAGKTVNNGGTVHLVVSKGAETSYVDMVDVCEIPVEEAKEKLLGNGFIVGKITKEYSSKVKEGAVIRQSVPAGTSSAQRYTVVDLVVSMGRDPYAPVEEEPDKTPETDEKTESTKKEES